MNNFGYDLCIEHDLLSWTFSCTICIVWSNDSIVSKSVGLVSVFEIFILHDGHSDSISVFALNEAIKQFRQNVYSHLKIFIGFLIISEQILHMQRETWGFKSSLWTSCNVTVAGIIDCICRARESKKIYDHKKGVLCFCLSSAFAFFLGAKFSGSKYPFFEKLNFVTNVAMLNTVFSPIFESSSCYCALPFNSSRHNSSISGKFCLGVRTDCRFLYWWEIFVQCFPDVFLCNNYPSQITGSRFDTIFGGLQYEVKLTLYLLYLSTVVD